MKGFRYSRCVRLMNANIFKMLNIDGTFERCWFYAGGAHHKLVVFTF
jgi:hypothetical protein